jgi:hypothetical protein
MVHHRHDLEIRQTEHRVVNKQFQTWHVILKRHSHVDKCFVYLAPVGPSSCRCLPTDSVLPCSCMRLDISTDIAGGKAVTYRYLKFTTENTKEPQWLRRYSDCLQEGRRKGPSSSPGRVKNFSSPFRPDLLCGPHSFLSNGYRRGVPSPGEKWPAPETDHSLSTSAKIKNTWTYTSTPPYAFLAYCLISWAKGNLPDRY